jgi:hypothetical protein
VAPRPGAYSPRVVRAKREDQYQRADRLRPPPPTKLPPLARCVMDLSELIEHSSGHDSGAVATALGA